MTETISGQRLRLAGHIGHHEELFAWDLLFWDLLLWDLIFWDLIILVSRGHGSPKTTCIYMLRRDIRLEIKIHAEMQRLN